MRRRSKYNNRRVTFGDEVFDSVAEWNEYLKLNKKLSDGAIKNLQRQVVFKTPIGIRYTADFVVTHLDGALEIVEVKSEWTRKARDVSLRKKIIKYFFPEYKFTEIISGRASPGATVPRNPQSRRRPSGPSFNVKEAPCSQ